MAEAFSLLRTASYRPLPVALAQAMANAKATDDRWPAFNRLFMALPMADKLRCQDELRQCRLAKRGELEALVA